MRSVTVAGPGGLIVLFPVCQLVSVILKGDALTFKTASRPFLFTDEAARQIFETAVQLSRLASHSLRQWFQKRLWFEVGRMLHQKNVDEYAPSS